MKLKLLFAGIVFLFAAYAYAQQTDEKPAMFAETVVAMDSQGVRAEAVTTYAGHRAATQEAEQQNTVKYQNATASNAGWYSWAFGLAMYNALNKAKVVDEKAIPHGPPDAAGKSKKDADKGC